MKIQTVKEYRKDVMDRSFPSASITHVRIGNSPKGGLTIVRLWLGKGSFVTGFAFCWEFDTYNKRKGKSIAFGRLMRALDELGLSKRKLASHEVFISAKLGTINHELFEKARKGEKIE